MQAAGYIGKTFEESKPLHEIVVAAVQAANESLVGPRRLWVMGGAGAAPGLAARHIVLLRRCSCGWLHAGSMPSEAAV